MKYWKEKENNPVENMQFWTGTYITKLAENEIFLYGSNPQGINGAGAAKAAMSLSKGAKHGVGRGFNGSNAYALVTKSLNAGFLEKSTGILYNKEGYCSLSPEQIRTNIDELYEIARSPEHKDKKFLVSYQYESWPNGSPKKSLNGYTSQEMLEMFAKDKEVPPNIIFHESYKPHLEKLYKNQNKQINSELVIFEDDKTIDIKEEDIIWTIDSDERNPSGIHGAGAAKAAMAFGATYGNGRGISGQSYALVTKNLKSGFVEKSTGIKYETDGYRSVSREQIIENIKQLYELAKSDEYKNKKFLISYQYETWPNGSAKKSLNGYTSQEIFEMFTSLDIPNNIIFHESYKNKLEEKLKQNINYNSNNTNNNNTENNKSKDYTFFFSLTSPFSNFHPAKFTYKDYTFSSTEQFMMFCKAKLFKDEDIAQKLLDINNLPLVQKFLNGEINRLDIVNNKELANQWNEIQKGNQKLGRQVKNYNDQIWNSKRFNMVRTGLKEKFKQNKELGEILLKTKNSTLVEASPYDKLSTMEPNIQKSKEYSLMLPILQKLKEEFLVENKERNKPRP